MAKEHTKTPTKSRANNAGKRPMPILIAWLLLLSNVGSYIAGSYKRTTDARDPKATIVGIASTSIQVRFSPNGQCTEFTTAAIAKAQKSILVQAYSFTSAPIAEALIKAHERGVAIQVLIDRSQLTARGTKLHLIVAKGIPVFIDVVPGIAHNKVMIIDDAYVLTGSFNWTDAAEKRNAENLLLVKDSRLNEIYRANWKKRAAKARAYQRPS